MSPVVQPQGFTPPREQTRLLLAGAKLIRIGWVRAFRLARAQ